MRIFLENNPNDLGEKVANYIVKKINSSTKKFFVLGLPTGSTPIPTYKALIKLYKQGKVSFKNVITFNMDEYLGVERNHPQSYYTFMQENLFKFIDVKKENTNFLDGMTSDNKKCCQEYEDKIIQLGGIDLFLGGLGSNGHIAFNEPFSSLTSRTREKQLTEATIKDNARFFSGEDFQPTSALTVGIQTVMDAKEVIIIATGDNKAEAVKQALLEPISHTCPATILQTHQTFTLASDTAAIKHISDKVVQYFKHIATMGG